MKLFLASALSETVDQLFSAVPTIKKVAFVANASDHIEGEKWWIDIDRKAFEQKGAEVIPVDLRKENEESLKEILDSVDTIHVCGGSVLYPNHLIKERGLADVLINYIKDEKVLYSGTSAGSMIVSKDLTICKYDCDEEKVYKTEGNISGLGLVDFIIMPHANNDDFKEANLAVVEHLSEFKQPVFFLYDNQALLVEDNAIKLMYGKKRL